MQHTEKRYFNIIETTDTFSPEALNDNAHKLEAALDGLEDYADAGDAALEARIVELERFRFAYGVYTGTGVDNRLIQLPFPPLGMLLQRGVGTSMLAVKGMEGIDPVIRLTDDGFVLVTRSFFNEANGNYGFMAFGIAE